MRIRTRFDLAANAQAEVTINAAGDFDAVHRLARIGSCGQDHFAIVPSIPKRYLSTQLVKQFSLEEF